MTKKGYKQTAKHKTKAMRGIQEYYKTHSQLVCPLREVVRIPAWRLVKIIPVHTVSAYCRKHLSADTF